MAKKWAIIISIIAVIATLYFIELSKIKTDGFDNKLSLDNLKTDESSKTWDLFYKVRATIIDGQSAKFSIPEELSALDGKAIKLAGAPVFFGNGCKMINDTITSINSFFLLPTLGLANSCVLNPSEEMRWTIIVNLENPWILHRNDMINTEAIITGKFKIDTSKPYEAAFYIENATAKLK